MSRNHDYECVPLALQVSLANSHFRRNGCLI